MFARSVQFACGLHATDFVFVVLYVRSAAWTLRPNVKLLSDCFGKEVSPSGDVQGVPNVYGHFIPGGNHFNVIFLNPLS
jgi:hypothetical protein